MSADKYPSIIIYSPVNHGVLWAKSKNFEGLVFIPKRRNYFFGIQMVIKNTNRCLSGLRMEY